MVQAITVSDHYFPTYRQGSDYIRQHAFPGGMLLSEGQIRDAAARAGLQLRNSFAFGPDYARTCRTCSHPPARPAFARPRASGRRRVRRGWQVHCFKWV